MMPLLAHETRSATCSYLRGPPGGATDTTAVSSTPIEWLDEREAAAITARIADTHGAAPVRLLSGSREAIARRSSTCQ
jgi:hypothetical protein